MGKNDDLSEDKSDEEDKIFDLSLDDISPEDMDQASATGRTDSEIIELMELVGKGGKDPEDSDEDLNLSYDEDNQPTKEMGDAARNVNVLSQKRKAPREEVPLSETDMVLANISLETDISLLEGEQPGKGGRGEKLGEEKKAAKPPVKPEAKKIIKQQDSPPERKAQVAQPPVKEVTTISEKKLEAIVRRVVEDVVERVARETMAEVAEKVIREAIDALKQSLEKDSE